MRATELLSVLPGRPGEFFDRVLMIAESRWGRGKGTLPKYEVVKFESAANLICSHGLGDLKSPLSERALLDIEARVKEGIQDLPRDAPFPSFHHGDSLLARCCYGLARTLGPEIVVETGVCYGVTSAYLLQALGTNSRGRLHSLDLPPLGKHGDDFVGRLIPAELKARWALHRGLSGKLLQPLLGKLGRIDMFIHDSLHTYRNMSMEFSLAWPALRPGGVLISDDIEGNSAFLELIRQPDVLFSVVIKEESKDVFLGIASKKK